MSAPPLWSAKGLHVVSRRPREAPVLRHVDLHIAPGERVAVLGDRHAGKSALAQLIVGLWPHSENISGQVFLDGAPYLDDPARLGAARRDTLAYIPQDVEGALCPHLTVGRQLIAAHQLAHDSRRKSAEAASRRMLSDMGIVDAKERFRQLPHQLGLDERQRVLIGMAHLGRSRLIIADEPTSALDVTGQARVLEQLRTACMGTGRALLLFTHDPTLAWLVAERVVVMHAGAVVESGAAADVIERPQHPLTEAIVNAVPPGLRDTLRRPGKRDAQHDGCAFAGECAYAEDACSTTFPQLHVASNGHAVRCPVRAEVAA